jgi:hypothetical protein
MKNKAIFFFSLFCIMMLFTLPALAQCSICTRTVQQLGEKPAENLNAGILYLAAAPLTICGILGYRWWKKNSSEF